VNQLEDIEDDSSARKVVKPKHKKHQEPVKLVEDDGKMRSEQHEVSEKPSFEIETSSLADAPSEEDATV